MKSKLLTALVYVALASPALAHHTPTHRGGPPPHVPKPPVVHQVPEIDASAGLLAIAAVASITLLAWERSRRRREAV
ncbi:VPEID-CTERM sorting domain-containing protein [Rubellimicrobium arenae]|nr:VPEID-CTERM sorting domain-containing protein [Rubellimicrobium arenae]